MLSHGISNGLQNNGSNEIAFMDDAPKQYSRYVQRDYYACWHTLEHRIACLRSSVKIDSPKYARRFDRFDRNNRTRSPTHHSQNVARSSRIHSRGFRLANSFWSPCKSGQRLWAFEQRPLPDPIASMRVSIRNRTQDNSIDPIEIVAGNSSARNLHSGRLPPELLCATTAQEMNVKISRQSIRNVHNIYQFIVVFCVCWNNTNFATLSTPHCVEE